MAGRSHADRARTGPAALFFRFTTSTAGAGKLLRAPDLRSKIKAHGQRAGGIMTPRSVAGLALSGTVALAGWGAVGLGTFNASPVEDTTASIADRASIPRQPAVMTTVPLASAAAAGDSNLVSEAAAGDSSPPEPVVASASASAAEAPAAEPVLADADPKRAPETGMQLASVPSSDPKQPPETRMRLASALPSAPMDDGPKPPVRAIEPPTDCVADICIDAYLWSLYERTPKIDTVKVPQRTKVTVKKKGKTRTVTKTVMTYVVSDFTWKDPAAAQRVGMPVLDYVIGGMDRGFKLKLYRVLRTMDDAGLMPGITSGFRDDYRQSLASGNKAATDSSFHGGSRRGGYRHGLAADLASVKGDTRMQRFVSSEELWKWIDAHEKEFGIGRPYLDRDPPHVGPVDGREYAVKRSRPTSQRRALPTRTAEKRRLETTRPQLAARNASGAPTRASPAKLSKLSSLQKRHPLQR